MASKNEELSPEDRAKVSGFREGRKMAFVEMWELFRDAPEGPMMDAMKMVQKKMDEIDDSRPGNG